MQEETTPIFKRLWYDWTQQQPGIEPTNPLGQCWVPPIVAFYDQQGLLRTYSLPGSSIRSSHPGSCILAASSLSPGQLAYSEKVGPLLSRQKATRPSEYILGPLSSESEEEVEGGPPGDQPLRRAGSGSLVENREPPKPHVRVRIEEDPKGGIGGETICPIEPELGVEVEERGGTTPVDTDSEGSLASQEMTGRDSRTGWTRCLLRCSKRCRRVIRLLGRSAGG